MDKQKDVMSLPKKKGVPQIPVRSSLNAGASLENCLQNLAYWQNQYAAKCGGVPTPY